jgi:hypothetical protein
MVRRTERVWLVTFFHRAHRQVVGLRQGGVAAAFGSANGTFGVFAYVTLPLLTADALCLVELDRRGKLFGVQTVCVSAALPAGRARLRLMFPRVPRSWLQTSLSTFQLSPASLSPPQPLISGTPTRIASLVSRDINGDGAPDFVASNW